MNLTKKSSYFVLCQWGITGKIIKKLTKKCSLQNFVQMRTVAVQHKKLMKNLHQWGYTGKKVLFSKKKTFSQM